MTMTTMFGRKILSAAILAAATLAAPAAHADNDEIWEKAPYCDSGMRCNYHKVYAHNRVLIRKVIFFCERPDGDIDTFPVGEDVPEGKYGTIRASKERCPEVKVGVLVSLRDTRLGVDTLHKCGQLKSESGFHNVTDFIYHYEVRLPPEGKDVVKTPHCADVEVYRNTVD